MTTCGPLDWEGCADAVRRLCPSVSASWAVILGSGAGPVAADLLGDGAWSVGYGELPGFPTAGVSGHAGRLWGGTVGGIAVWVLSGRSHYYEGRSLDEVTFPVRVLHALGVRSLLLTNASGGIGDGFEGGSFAVIRDHINFAGWSPLRGVGAAGGERFVDLVDAYSPAIRAVLRESAARAGVQAREAVYAAVNGPHYETPAEIRALAVLGADLVGMSTVAEVIVARQLGMGVGAISLVTNRAAGLSAAGPDHGDVLEAAASAGGRLTAWLREFFGAAARVPGSGI